MPDFITQGRDAFERQEWKVAFERLTSADRAAPLDAGDIERLAIAAYLLGLDEESATFWARAHQEFLSGGSTDRALRCAFWLGFGLLGTGESARAAGWLARARRLLEARDQESVEHGYLLFSAAYQSIAGGDNAAARAGFGRVAEIGARFGDRDLVAMARHGEGRALIRMGETSQGVELLDEMMVAVTAGEVSPMVAGDIYCGVLSACQEIFDLRRAREWTTALHVWCGGQPSLVAFRGQCLIRRAELARLQGDWPEAVAEAERACEHFTRSPGQHGAGDAFYQLGELHRLSDDWSRAEAAYRESSRLGRRPQPGLAQLRLAQGQQSAAAAAIRGALEESPAQRTRSQLLPAFIEIMLATGDGPAARAGALELEEAAGSVDSPLLRAAAAHARGSIHLYEGDARAALGFLRHAAKAWRDIAVPYEAARTGILIAIACRMLEDPDTADLELESARAVLARLGALSELERLHQRFQSPSRPPAPGGLTVREQQVLALVATGKTNRAIATALAISEKTVARHLSNIFTKLGISSRAAATAYAYQQRLVTSDK